MFVVDAARRLHRGMTALQRKMLPAPAALFELASSMWRPHALGVVAELGVADLLADGPRDVAELARETGANEDSLYRLLRALAHDGILARPAPRRFGLTSLSEPLRSDHPTSMRNTVRMLTSDYGQQTWIRLRDAVMDGQPQFSTIYGGDLWSYFEEHPDEGAGFHAAMGEITRATAPMLAAAYDFGQHRTVVDLGGGQAVLLSILLQMFPTLRGVNYDLEQAVIEAPHTLEEAGVKDRCEIVTGSFLDRVPAGHDAYMLKHIVHILSDDELDRLFGNLRDGIAPGGTLILIEMLVPEDDGGTHPSFMDLQMLLANHGRERTATEYGDLLASRGFQLRAILHTPSPMALVVGERV